ncbi:prolyl-tRNA synthetase [Clostridiales bacterium PH28_bin88]|nr:prolyl-tRNA synthetase [Clostridiales bacterium PH28_bin88]
MLEVQPTVEAIARVRRFLEETPYRPEIIEFDESTHTSELAARAVGVEVGQIAKSILLIIGDQPVLVVTSGDMKVSQSKLKQVLGASGKVKLADPDTTMELTGFPPGGVCPFALKQPVPVLIDRSMERFPVVYAAAGTPRSAVPVSVAQLLDITGGTLCDLA